MSNEKCLIVGVDYGTTYSGVAFVESDGVDLQDVQVIAEWDNVGQKNDYLVKAPSRISYGPGSTVSWGYNIKPGAVAYSWTKLLLDDRAAVTQFDDPQLRSILDSGLLRLPPGKTAQEVTTDYLRELYKHTMSILEHKISAAILRTMKIKFWFSMPAIWSDEAQYATRDAAKAAGFASRPGDEIFMVKEPAAAAIASLNQFISKGPSPLVQVDQGIMVVDCGGGTVDLTSFVVRKAYPKLELEQTCVSMGGKCGSTAIDRNFYQLLSDRFGTQFSNLPAKQRGLGSTLMRDWESAKRNFGISDNDRTELFYLPGLSCTNDDYYDSDDDEIRITRNDMKHLFDPVIDQVIALVDQQIKATKSESSMPISTVVLAGGFGESMYLYKRLKAWCPSGINLVCPPQAWSAIVRGAALRGLEGPIFIKEKCPLNYGTNVGRAFRTGFDKESDSYMDPFSKIKLASGYMGWIYQKGEDIRLNTRKVKSYTFVHTEGSPMRRSFPIFTSKMAIAPDKENHFSVEKLCDVDCVWNQGDLNNFQSEFTSLLSFKRIYRFTFDIEALTGDDLGLLHFQFTTNGRVFGTAEVRWKKS